jgi:hypothetical protein
MGFIMARFLTGNSLNSELEKLFEKAENLILIISPYIKLHERFISTLKAKKGSPEIEIVIVFGKNEDNFSKSMKEGDFNFFKEFPNVEIRYEKRLHAKYYANETTAIITSMNLYSYSQDQNIEAGVLTNAPTMLGSLAKSLIENNLDNEAWNYFNRVVEQSELLFKRRPVYDEKLMGFAKQYKTSKTEIDNLSEFFAKLSRKETMSTNKSVEVKLQDTIATIINSENFLSTTALAKQLGISSKELFFKFEKLQWIERKNEDWILTTLGKKQGGQVKKGQYGDYIAWPESVSNSLK